MRSMFRFIIKMFSGVEVRSLEFFHPSLTNHVFIDLALCTGALGHARTGLVSVPGKEKNLRNVKAYKNVLYD